MPLTGVRLNAKKEDELKEAFIIYDTDGDGKVNKEQACCVIRSIGLCPTNEELNMMLDDNRLFSLKDVHDRISSKAPPFETEEGLREAFRIFDKDGNGFGDVTELRHVLVHLGEKLNDEEVDALMREVDISGHNQLNLDDAVRVIQSLS